MGRDLAAFAWKTLRKDPDLWKDADGLVPVPLHRRRLRQRGFNQAAVLGRYLAGWTGVPLIGDGLMRTKDVPPQASLDSKERRRNVRGAFAVRRRRNVSGRVLILVDDVFTTGATVSACCEALLRAGAKDLRVVTLARVPSGKG